MGSKKEDLYVFIGNDTYRVAKSQILESQADLLRVMRRLQNLKFLARQKADLKTHLHTLFEMLVGEVNLMEKNLPKPLLPKIIHEASTLGMVPEEIKKDYSKHDEIDSELQIIREKLKILNS